ncbi:hypothetical protein [Shinella sp. BYT-45]|uniref:hypothetical protein n=1 Tax=Shinella sp. BYT-45 TaxID=3377377 RepID=UPI00397E9E85
MTDSLTGEACRAAPSERLSGLQAFGLVFCTALILVLADMADGVRFHADVDDELRALQIAHLLSPRGSWFDLTLPFVATPDPYVSPWSRLIDLPYALLAGSFSWFLPQATALKAAFWLWPPMMLAGFSMLAAFIVGHLSRDVTMSRTAEAVSLMLMTLLMSFAVLEFAPGRIDHHNMQLLLLLAIAAGFCRWDRLGGALVGAGSALSVVIGLECLPFVVLSYAGLVAAYLFHVRRSRDVLVAASLSMIATTLASAAAFLGLAGSISVQCDAFSAPYIVLMVGFSLIFGVVGFVVPARFPLMARAGLLTVPSAGLLAAAAWLFPACRAGPYSMIDPLSRRYWFERIWQEQSVLQYYGTHNQFGHIALLALLAVMLVLFLPVFWARSRRGGVAPAIVYALMIAAYVLTLVLTRYIRFPAALVPLALPAIVGWFLSVRNDTRMRRVVAAAVSACLAAFILPYLAIPLTPRAFDAVDYMTFDQCAGEDFSVLATVAPGRIALPNGLSLPLLEHAPAGFSVAAIPFHRASPGMRRMYEAFLSSDPAVRKAALAPFDYVAVCRFPLESDPSFAPLYAALSAGKDWPGLMRVAPPAETRFQLFRIDHGALR